MIKHYVIFFSLDPKDHKKAIFDSICKGLSEKTDRGNYDDINMELYKDVFTEVKIVESREIVVKEIPSNVFAYRFFDRQEETKADGETYIGPPQNYSPRTIFGIVCDLKEAEILFPEEKQIIENMKLYGWGQVIKTICGNWVIMQADDRVI